MKGLIKRITIKIVVTILICSLLSLVLSAIMPTFGNDIAMGQLENDDVSFAVMETWNRIQNGVGWVQASIAAICGISCGIDAYKFIKTNKGENE